jgi:carbonic anhydrase/acetyltransferase-like protein (isoleucine patch superfamily)
MIRSYQGKLPQIPSSCYIDPSAQILGDVVFGERSSVWMNAVVRGDVNSIRVGSCSNVQDCAVLHGQRNLYPVIVGDWVTIGHNATVHGCTVGDTDRRGVHHCRRVGGSREHRGSPADVVGRRSGEDAA